MALIGIVNLADRILNQSQSQTPAEQSSADPASALPAGGKPLETPAPSGSDHFTSSALAPAADASAQTAGLFSVTTLSLFTAAANFLLGPGANAGANSPATPAATPPETAAANSAANSGATSTATAPVANTANFAPTSSATSAATADSNATAADSSAPSAAPIVESLNFIPAPSITQTTIANSELQALNTALAALGLPQREITIIDSIASLLQDSNSVAYSDLLHQFEVLAEKSTPQTTALAVATAATAAFAATVGATTTATTQNSAVAQSSASVTNLNTAVPNAIPTAGTVPKESSATSGATGGAFRVQELVMRFAGSNKTPSSQRIGNESASRTAEAPASSRQVEEVSVTLTNHSGQKTKLQVPTAKSTLTSNPLTIFSRPRSKTAGA